VKLFEFEAKETLREYGIAMPRSGVAYTPDQAETIAAEIGGPVAVKAQIQVAHRAKAGGILFADSPAEAREAASGLLGSTIKGIVVDCLLIEEKLDIVEELYASATVIREAKRYVVLASTSGGSHIEEVARTSPEKILRHWVDPEVGFGQDEAEAMMKPLAEMDRTDISRFASVVSVLYRAAMDSDAELVEINPLAMTSSGELMAADARMIIDDNALFRHPEFKDRSFHRIEDTPREAEARRQDLTYVDLSGDIGIVGNGAGLVMATMDTVRNFGGEAANFLDIGGGAQTDVIKRGLMLVMSKPEVRAVLFNIHGGITRCDIAAEGVVQALREASIKKPLVVRMMGTNEEAGIEILRRNGIEVYHNMDTAAEAVLEL